MKTTKLFALVLSLFLLALPLTSCTLGADENLTARLDSMEALISQQNATIEGLNAKLTEQSSTIAGQNAIINGLNSQLFEQNTTIGDLNNQISEQDKTISDLASQVDESMKEPSQKRILLTKDNYKDYIAFNITYSDFRFQESPDTPLGEYLYMCNMTITTYAKIPGISFSGVSINYAIDWDTPLSGSEGVEDFWITEANPDHYDQTTDLSFEGYSMSTFHFINYDDTGIPSFLNTHQSILAIDTITGYVIITE